MPDIGKRVHELRVVDDERKATWRVIYRIDTDAIVILEIFKKTTRATPKPVIKAAKERISRYDAKDKGK